MTWEMAERWVASGWAVLVSDNDHSIAIETKPLRAKDGTLQPAVRFTVWAKGCEL